MQLETQIQTNVVNHKGIITINRPETLNSIDLKTCIFLLHALDEMINNSTTKLIILTGAGEKSFISGGDLNDEVRMDAMQAYQWAQVGDAFCNKIENSPKPIIAAVNGYCLGAGTEFILACDFVIASDNAKFATPGSKIGVHCCFGGNVRMPRMINIRNAKEILMTSKFIDAKEALRIGLVNKVVPLKDLQYETDLLCDDLIAKDENELSFIKSSIEYGYEMDYSSALQYDAALMALRAESK